MAVKYGKFELPSEIWFQEDGATPTYARFIAEPFEKGFAHTIGNSLRRMLLSSIEAPSIVSLRIEGVSHEYMAIEGVVEDATNIVLNLKGALLRRHTPEQESRSSSVRMITQVVDVTEADLAKAKGQVVITLGDVVKDPLFEVVNPELALFTVTQPFKRQIDLRVATGRGYVSNDRLREIIPEIDQVVDEILIDAAFSPVRLVKYSAEKTRVGQNTDYDRLILEITTDGRITPQEALGFASQIGLKHFKVFEKIAPEPLVIEEDEEEISNGYDEILEKLSLRIDEIELSVRSTNCLSGANIEFIGELVTIPERKMLEFRNFGKKSLTEIKAKLLELQLTLDMDLSRFGIDMNNIRQLILEFREAREQAAESAAAAPARN